MILYLLLLCFIIVLSVCVLGWCCFWFEMLCIVGVDVRSFCLFWVMVKVRARDREFLFRRCKIFLGIRTICGWSDIFWNVVWCLCWVIVLGWWCFYLGVCLIIVWCLRLFCRWRVRRFSRRCARRFCFNCICVFLNCMFWVFWCSIFWVNGILKFWLCVWVFWWCECWMWAEVVRWSFVRGKLTFDRRRRCWCWYLCLWIYWCCFCWVFLCVELWMLMLCIVEVDVYLLEMFCRFWCVFRLFRVELIVSSVFCFYYLWFLMNFCCLSVCRMLF